MAAFSGEPKIRARWRSFWAKQVTPQHREDTSDHYSRYAKELTLLFPARACRMVLDIGCGNGAMFEPLGFDKADYTGVDFSPSMIAVFAKRYPKLRLVVANGDEYRDARSYDLILCNSVVQYFDSAMLDRWLGNAVAMLAPDGCIVIGSVPWRSLRFRYYTGELTGELPPAWLAALRIAKSLLSDKIGHWYSVREVTALGEQHGLRSEVFGSVLYGYRFHIRMSRIGAAGGSAGEH
jgi:SAM-dependent methyltransferase